jgi:hypothetical protein
MQSRFRWLVVTWLSLAVLFVMIASPGPAPHWPTFLPDDLEGLKEVSGTLLVVALVPLVLVLVLALLNADFRPPRPVGRDLDRLLQLKHQGLPRPRRLRESRTWASRTPSGASLPTAAGFASTAPPADVLARLVQRKRLAAWAPRLPDHVREGPAPPG